MPGKGAKKKDAKRANDAGPIMERLKEYMVVYDVGDVRKTSTINMQVRQLVHYRPHMTRNINHSKMMLAVDMFVRWGTWGHVNKVLARLLPSSEMVSEDNGGMDIRVGTHSCVPNQPLCRWRCPLW